MSNLNRLTRSQMSKLCVGVSLFTRDTGDHYFSFKYTVMVIDVRTPITNDKITRMMRRFLTDAIFHPNRTSLYFDGDMYILKRDTPSFDKCAYDLDEEYEFKENIINPKLSDLGPNTKRLSVMDCLTMDDLEMNCTLIYLKR